MRLGSGIGGAGGGGRGSVGVEDGGGGGGGGGGCGVDDDSSGCGGSDGSCSAGAGSLAHTGACVHSAPSGIATGPLPPPRSALSTCWGAGRALGSSRSMAATAAIRGGDAPASRSARRAREMRVRSSTSRGQCTPPEAKAKASANWALVQPVWMHSSTRPHANMSSEVSYLVVFATVGLRAVAEASNGVSGSASVGGSVEAAAGRGGAKVAAEGVEAGSAGRPTPLSAREPGVGHQEGGVGFSGSGWGWPGWHAGSVALGKARRSAPSKHGLP